jgi:DNA-binding response OmpR family regulator
MVRKRPAVLIVDDEGVICDLVREELAGQGYVCDTASNADEALAKLKRHSFDVALLDINLPGLSGMDLLKTVEKRYPMTAIIMITAVNDLNTAVEAMKLGASDYIIKPFTLDKINACISTILRNRELHSTVYNTVLGMRDADYGKNANGRSLSEINAIAYGVDAQVDYFDSHSKIVTEKTVELTRWLGLPGKEIEKWAVARDELYSERDRRIRSALNKLERNVMAQVMLGLTRSVCQFAKSPEAQN